MEITSNETNKIKPDVVQRNTDVSARLPQAAVESATRTADTDAVRLAISQRQGSTKEDEAARTEQELESRERLEEARKRFEEAFNSTTVRFDVALAERKEGELRFQVVERETGEVVREFPPEEAKNFIAKLESGSEPVSLLFDEAV